MTRDEFEPTGAWWDRPLWKRAALMVTLRPYCMVKGYVAAARQWIALRAPNRPFHPMAWVHPSPCADFPYECHHDEFHPADDGCTAGHERGGAHYLEYDRSLDCVRSLADDFDSKVGRYYRFSRPLEEIIAEYETT